MSDPALTRPRGMLERELEVFFRATVRRLGGRAIKIAPTEKGAPDRLVLLPGGVVQLVELKAVAGRVSPAQEVWHARAADLGTTVHLLWGRAGVIRWEREARAEIAAGIDRLSGLDADAPRTRTGLDA